MTLKITKEQRDRIRQAHATKFDRAKAFALVRLIRDNPKSYRAILLQGPKKVRFLKYKILTDWIFNKTLVNTDTFAEVCYSAVFQDEGKCKRGNQKHVSRFFDGFINCSKTCECANERRKELCRIEYYARFQNPPTIPTDLLNGTNNV